MRLSLAVCAEWMGGELRAPVHAEAAGYSIDTRTLAPGELFFAVSGEHYDAHAFAAKAIGQGAIAAVLAEEKLGEPEFVGLRGLPHIAVDEPLMALQRLGAAVRRRWGGTVVGITGSAGKTTTKEMVAAVLGARFRVLKSAGNLNNHFGVPLQLLRLEHEHAYAVIEMGMSNAGEIALLASLAKPDWAVVTNVGVAHAQNFADGIEGISRAKRELVDALSSGGVAFLNADDARVAGFARGFAGRSVLAGLSEAAEVRAVTLEERGTDGLWMEVRAGEASAGWIATQGSEAGGESGLRGGKAMEAARFPLHFLGVHNAVNALLALAVGREAGVPLADGAAALSELMPGEKRGELLELRGAQILNDCYNSNPAALSAMLRTLMRIPAERHIVVAGEMLELGPKTGELHARCGAEAAGAGADWVIGVQGAALALAEAAAKLGTRALFFQDALEAGAWLARELRPGDAVLLKGSRGVRLERALEGL